MTHNFDKASTAVGLNSRQRKAKYSNDSPNKKKKTLRLVHQPPYCFEICHTTVGGKPRIAFLMVFIHCVAWQKFSFLRMPATTLLKKNEGFHANLEVLKCLEGTFNTLPVCSAQSRFALPDCASHGTLRAPGASSPTRRCKQFERSNKGWERCYR